jgi:HrpA-like RNA helicase
VPSCAPEAKVNHSHIEILTLDRTCTLRADPGVGKLLVLGASFDCLGDVLTLAAFEGIGRGPFYEPVSNREEARKRHRQFCTPDHSDHWAMAQAFYQYLYIQQAHSARAAEAWCWDNFLKAEVLEKIQPMRIKLAKVWHGALVQHCCW